MDTKLLGLILQGDKKNEREFNRIKETYEELSNSKANTITNSANGESIVLSDSADSTLASLRVMGKTEQFTTTGANLLDLYGAKSGTSGGVTVTANPDGSLTYSGTSESNVINVWLLGSFLGDPTVPEQVLFTLPAGSYSLFGCVLYTGTTAVGYNTLSNSSTTFSLTEDTPITAIRASEVRTGTTVNTTVYPMLNKGSTALPYEPYTGGIPSPNPQYPQEIVSAGDDGEVEANVFGGNLLDASALTDNKATHECFENGRKITVTGSGAYSKTVFTLQLDVLNQKVLYYNGVVTGGNSPAFTPCIRCKDGTSYFIHPNKLRAGYLIDNSIMERMELHLICNNTSDVLDTPTTAVFEDVMLMLDPNATWTPYKPAQPLTISTPNGLPGIKVTDPSIATYTDEDGQMWCADEVDFERGVYVKRIEKVDITRDKYTRSDLYETYNKFSFTTNILYDTDNYVQRQLPTMSNRFIANAASIVGYFNTLTVANGGWSGCARSIFTVDKSIASLDDFMNYAGDDCYVLTLLPTPIETPLSESELAAYKSLHTNYPVTTIQNDSGAHMEVEYTADKKNYIDNKFTQITNAVLSMGSNI